VLGANAVYYETPSRSRIAFGPQQSTRRGSRRPLLLAPLASESVATVPVVRMRTVPAPDESDDLTQLALAASHYAERSTAETVYRLT
jgi:hypothetical protein